MVTVVAADEVIRSLVGEVLAVVAVRAPVGQAAAGEAGEAEEEPILNFPVSHASFAAERRMTSSWRRRTVVAMEDREKAQGAMG